MAATLYFAAFTSANTPTWARADIANGRHGFSSTGYAASGSTTTGVPTSGTGNDQSVGITLSGLSAGTEYKIWLIWDDGSNTSNSGSPVGSAAFRTSYTLALDAGSYTVTGNDATLTISRALSLDAGSYAVTGNDATLTVGRTLGLDAGSYTVTGQDAGLAVNRALALDAGSYSVTGNTADLTYSGGGATYAIALDAGSYAVTGRDATLTVSRTVALDAGSYSVTGNDSTIARGFVLALDAGSYTLTGNDAAFARTRVLECDAGAYTLTGHDATLTYSGAPAEPEVERRRGAGASRFVLARKRLPSAYLIDWLTNEDPSEETKRVIQEIKAGRPLPESLNPPKVNKSMSPTELASKLIPRRLVNLSEVLPVQQTQLIRKAARIAQEMDDEDILMLL